MVAEEGLEPTTSRLWTLHSAHPDEKDIAAVKEFVNWIMENTPEETGEVEEGGTNQ